MKKNFLFVAMLLVALSFGFVSCDMINGNDPDDTTQDGSENVVEDEKQDPVSLESVDLGLSVKWANCNVGATKPEEYGDFYAWGEVAPKTYYDWATYKWTQGNDMLIKYFTDEGDGNGEMTADNKTVLDAGDDIASVSKGGNWRIPTVAEVEELINGCIWTWTTLNGVEGYEVKSQTNDNTIFLPAAGGRFLDEHGALREECLYWSSSLAVEENFSAWSLNASEIDGVYLNPIPRNYGFSIRGVTK